MKTCLILEGFAFFMLHPENSSNITNDSGYCSTTHKGFPNYF
jgi:hypothetical protein